MNKIERHQQIIDIINEEKKVVAKDLAQRLNISEDTMRRDLRELDQKKLIHRIHSGAIRIGPPETMFQYRINSNTSEKKRLAEKALTLIHEDSVILIDGGTTNLAFAKALPKNFRGTIITNSPPIVMALEMHENLEVIILGGTLNQKYMVSMGMELADKVAKIHADYFIMGIYNIDAAGGLTVPTFEEALLKKKMVEASTEIISLVTAEKMDTISNYVIGSVSLLDTMVTTSNELENYQGAGVKIYACDGD